MRRLLFGAAVLLLIGVAIGLFQLYQRNEQQKDLFLPEAENDFVVGWVGQSNQASGLDTGEAPPVASEPSASMPQLANQASVTSVEAHFQEDSYPVGTQQLALVVTNQGSETLEYTHWFDFRQVAGEQLIPLAPREGAMVNPDDPNAVQRLEPGVTVTIPLSIDLFDTPLGPGTYRVAQLACFADPNGQTLACTEITADFELVPEKT